MSGLKWRLNTAERKDQRTWRQVNRNYPTWRSKKKNGWEKKNIWINCEAASSSLTTMLSGV